MAGRRRSSGHVEGAVGRLDPFRVERVRSALELLEDRRLFHPAGALRAPRSFFMRRRLVVAVPRKRLLTKWNALLSHRVGFDVPRDVAICVRRKTRREVIIAKRVARDGGGAKHRTIWSDVRC